MICRGITIDSKIGKSLQSRQRRFDFGPRLQKMKNPRFGGDFSFAASVFDRQACCYANVLVTDF